MSATAHITPTSSTPAQIRNHRWRIWRWVDWRLLLSPVLGILIYTLWKNTAESERYPAFMLPHPDTVWDRFQLLWERDLLLRHTWVTLREALYGLGIAVVIAIVIGYLIARVRLLDYVLMPYLIFLQAIPVIAISPLIIIWAGPEIKSKVFIAAFITWFPLMITTIVGLRNVSPNLRELMRANAASPWQVFWHLEVPSALPELLGGLKVGVTLAVIGAAVGEFVSSREGLGYLVLFGRGTSDTALVICAIFLLTLMSLALYGIIAVLEIILLRWKHAGRV